MAEIDQTDLLGPLRIRAWNARQEQNEKKPRPRPIGKVWPNIAP